MRVVQTVAELRQALGDLARPLGLVPTMGALHEGHLSLARRAKADNRSCALTIFVNPTQFGPAEDLSRYPRPIERDLDLAAGAGVDLVWNPPVDEVYPRGFATAVSVDQLSRRWEGEHRPGHFDGVATVVARILLLFQADRAYFGEKDYQQLQVVRRMVSDLAIPTEVVACPIIRDQDGLALSSRNVYLSAEERNRALALPQAIRAGVAAAAAGLRSISSLEQLMRAKVVEAGLSIDYLAIVDPETLEPAQSLDRPARVLAVVRVGSVRLLDNSAIS